MLKSALAIAAILASAPAHAASFVCTGGIMDYAFRLSGHVSGARVIGATHVVVTKSGSLLRQGSAPASGTFLAGRSLSFVSQDPHARITVSASYQGGSYVGPMAISSDQGNVTVTATCSVR